MPRYVMAAANADGQRPKQRVTFEPPTLQEVRAFGDGYQTTYVSVRDERDHLTLYGRDAAGEWTTIAADVDSGTAGEVGLWFELTRHYAGPSAGAEHALDRPPAGGRTRMSAPEAIAQVVARIRGRGLDYPTTGLTADRFPGGWSVYAPVEVDDSDPMAFLDMPVGRSVFLVGDTGRVKEISSSVPPRQAEELFTAEEAYVRRTPDEDGFLAALRDEVLRLDAESGGAAGISSFTVDAPVEVLAARAGGLVGPIVQHLALLGPPGWDGFTAAFSFTVSGELAELRFRAGGRDVDVRVPEQLAVLVRRQRHLAAQLPAGPWWRLLLALDHTAGASARLATEYDYGDRPLPDGQLLPPEDYRADLAAYPRPDVPPWLTAYLAEGPRPAAPRPRTSPRPATPRPQAAAPPRTPPPPPRPEPAAPAPPPREQRPEPDRTPPPVTVVLETTLGRKRLHASPDVITYGKHSLALADVEWVAYSATRIAEKRFMFPTFYTNEWTFQVGRYPYYGGDKISVNFSHAGRNAPRPPEWAFLVDLAAHHLEPRLLADLVARVRRGETVRVGGSVDVSQDGIASVKPRFSLVPWAALIPPQLVNGVIVVHRTGTQRPLLSVPLSLPNASLIPDLFATLARRRRA